MDYRNARPIHALIQRFAGEGLSANAMDQDGRLPELIEADGPEATAKALRSVLHRLRVDEGVKPWDIAVLTGARLEDSAIWHVPGRQFGNEVLGNRAVDDKGRSLGAAARDVPELPSDMMPCEAPRTRRCSTGCSRRRLEDATAPGGNWFG
jgi:hypothetical protein